MGWIEQAGGDARLAVRVVARSSRDAVDGVQGDALKVRLRAPPVDDRANAALVEFVAARLGLPRARVRIAGGARSRAKRLVVAGVRAAEVAARLAPATDG